MPSDPPKFKTRVVIPSDSLAVRNALCGLFDRLLCDDMPEDARDTAQIVLAEVLNNIVEHAYANSPGEIEVTLDISPLGLTCEIVDAGVQMPGGRLPLGWLPVLTDGDDLPEGGFGWHLIRTLSQDLHYRRIGGRNLLSFRIDTKQSTP